MMDSRRQELSTKDLKSICASIKYEARMLNHAAERLEELKPTASPAQDPWEGNMALECFLLHFRNLATFFHPPAKCRPSDVFAWHYSSGRTTKVYGASAFGESLGKDVSGISQRLAHITTGRVSGLECDVRKMRDEVGLAYKEWLDDLDESRFDKAEFLDEAIGLWLEDAQRRAADQIPGAKRVAESHTTTLTESYCVDSRSARLEKN